MAMCMWLHFCLAVAAAQMMGMDGGGMPPPSIPIICAAATARQKWSHMHIAIHGARYSHVTIFLIFFLFPIQAYCNITERTAERSGRTAVFFFVLDSWLHLVFKPTCDGDGFVGLRS